MYELKFDKNALKSLQSLEIEMGRRIWNKLKKCKLDPFRYCEPLQEINFFKLRVGDYRVLLTIKQEERVIQVHKIGHRKNVYDF